jgi:hypothetical protein
VVAVTGAASGWEIWPERGGIWRWSAHAGHRWAVGTASSAEAAEEAARGALSGLHFEQHNTEVVRI